MPEVRIPALAKINLRLEVIGKRSDGFHELRTIFQTISLQQEFRIPYGVTIELRKTIPAGRGLGGGSSDAAAALIGYLRLVGKKLCRERLFELAATLGADVPFFLEGGRALGVGKGDEIYPLPDISRRSLLVVSPESIHVPTPDAYRWLNSPQLDASQANAPQLTNFTGNPKLYK